MPAARISPCIYPLGYSRSPYYVGSVPNQASSAASSGPHPRRHLTAYGAALGYFVVPPYSTLRRPAPEHYQNNEIYRFLHVRSLGKSSLMGTRCCGRECPRDAMTRGWIGFGTRFEAFELERNVEFQPPFATVWNAIPIWYYT